jgi:threonine synthase
MDSRMAAIHDHLIHLEEPFSGERFPADVPATVSPRNGKPLLARYDLAAIRERVGPGELVTRGHDLWRYAELLPGGERVTLGERRTPLISCAALAGRFALGGLWIKDESGQPGGSFKARGMAVAVSRAKTFGSAGLMVPSAGNAAGAAAAYCARASIPLAVAMPDDTPASCVLECTVLGAEVHLVPGTISDCGAFLRERFGSSRFDLSTLREPYRIEGKKTLGLELWEQLGGEFPDVILYPAGGGTGLIGIWKALGELRELGWWSGTPPRLVAVQAEGCAPVVEAFLRGAETTRPWADPWTAAAGIRVPAPLGGELMLRAIRETGGLACVVAEADLLRWTLLGTRATGCLLCPEGGATLAALELLVRDGRIRTGERAVVFNTGSGLKYQEVLQGLSEKGA